MNVIGVVGEFNPFHLGHYDHFAQSRAHLGKDTPIVCVMSGDFVQRGAPAAFQKHIRAEAAVRCGADLVFELPLPWCLASAERFALGAVGLLDSLGVVTHLSFGSEVGDLAPLTALALAAREPENMQKIKNQMGAGMSFAAAREKVLHETLGPEAKLLQTPNNILGVEYLKALFTLDSAMIPMTTARTGAQHDKFSHGQTRSASQLRSMMEAGENIAPFVPSEAWHMPEREMAAGRGPVTMESLEQAIMSRLRQLSEGHFAALPDATEGLDNRLYRAVRSEPSVEGILSAVKTKRYPLSRLRRMLMCAALGVRADMTEGRPPYARLLASTERGRSLLRQMDETCTIPLINKPASAKELEGTAREIFTLTADARDFYVLGYQVMGERRGGSDWRTSPITL
jgi:predicted nucleotidyltransferase